MQRKSAGSNERLAAQRRERPTFDVRWVVAMSLFLSSLVGHNTQSCQASDDLSFSDGKG